MGKRPAPPRTPSRLFASKTLVHTFTGSFQNREWKVSAIFTYSRDHFARCGHYLWRSSVCCRNWCFPGLRRWPNGSMD